MSEQFQEKVTDLPILPLRDVVVYPQMVIPLFVGREKSILALDKAMEKNLLADLHGFVQSKDRLLSADEKRYHHVRIYDDITQR